MRTRGFSPAAGSNACNNAGSVAFGRPRAHTIALWGPFDEILVKNPKRESVATVAEALLGHPMSLLPPDANICAAPSAVTYADGAHQHPPIGNSWIARS